MSLLSSCKGFLRVLTMAAVGVSLASCAQVKVQSPLDYIGPGKGAAVTQPVTIGAASATQQAGVMATQPAEEIATQPAPSTQTDGEMPIPPVPPVPAAATQPLSLDISEAVLLSLENNQALAVERYRPQISRTAVEAERARFDPTLSGQLKSSQGKSRSPTTQPHKTTFGLSRSLSSSIGVDQLLPWGTQLSVGGSTGVSYPGTEAFDEFYASRIGVNVNQPLLRGFGMDVNLAALHQARIDVKISQYELRGFAQDLVATVQETYWDYALAQQQIGIVEQSLQLAEQQRDEIVQRIGVGKLAQTELAAAQAQVALRQGNLIDARSNLARTRLSLVRLLNPSGPEMWNRDIILQSMPGIPTVELGGVEEYVAVALRMRPDLNQARLQLQKDELSIVRTKNGLLPQLDFFINVGRTGYAESFDGSLHGRDGLGYDVQMGGTFELSPINRAARAAYTASVLNRSQQLEAVKNLEHLAQVDVRSAFIEIGRTSEQVTATAETRKAQEETLRAETEKFRVGKSTSLLVAAASRDLLVARLAEVQAVVGYLKALIELYRLDGTLLVRMGIEAPGFQPTTLAAK